MIALDTNVLVRYLVEDEPREQCERAARFIERAVDAGEDVFLSDIVVCETVWVLESAYNVDRERVVGVLNQLLETGQIRFHNHSLVRRAADAYESSSADFADYLIREVALDAGCDAVATFDQNTLTETGFIEP